MIHPVIHSKLLNEVSIRSRVALLDKCIVVRKKSFSRDRNDHVNWNSRCSHYSFNSKFAIPTSSPTGVRAAPTPNQMPTYRSNSRITAPTVLPTPVVASTQAPRVRPTTPGSYCPIYSASNTNSDTTNYSIRSISVCPGDTVTMTTFAPGSCNGVI